MSKLGYHFEIMGRILAFLVNNGINQIDLKASDVMDIVTERQGTEQEVIQTFYNVLQWMEVEGLITIKNSLQDYGGGFYCSGIQLTSRGIAVSRKRTDDGDTIESKVADKKPGDLDSSAYTKIGDFVGSLLGGFTKSISS